MLLKIHPNNPAQRQIKLVVECLMDGGVIIYPTDTIYGFGCDIFKAKAVERIAKIKGINAEKANFSFVCKDLSHISDYAKPISNRVFKVMKANLPGAFTFIVEANSSVPKLIQNKKKTVGIRVPDNKIPIEIVSQLGNPIMSTSLRDDEDDVAEYLTDPELIYEKYNKIVDIVIDGGFGDNVPSTVVDCTNDDFDIIREGKGDLVL